VRRPSRGPGFETVYVVLSGSVDIVAAGERFSSVGKRKNIWREKDSVYAPVGPS
jgi:5-deoxy-D-glucuronate isomerase